MVAEGEASAAPVTEEEEEEATEQQQQRRRVVVAGPANSDLLLSLPAVFLNCPSPYERPSVCVAQCTQLETDTDSASTFAALPPAVVIALALL